MNTVLLAIIAAGVIYLCLMTPIPAMGQRRPWLSQAVFHYDQWRRRRRGQ